ncbi:MAG TPA: acyltransferase family protein, partial [Parvibaculum sp.]
MDWIDTDKGLSIILVVARHTAYGVAASTGHMPFIFGLISTLSLPYRMPLFFVVAGLFAASALKRPLREFLDKKLVHFAYFYFLWSAIQIGIKVALPGEGNHVVAWKDLLLSPIEPFGVLWFIYALPLFFMIMRLTRNVPKALVLGVALIFYFARIDTGWTVPDEAALRFVFFAGGVYGAPYVFQIAGWARVHAAQAVVIGAVTLVSVGIVALSGLIDLRAIELLSGVAGCI